ncbi:AAA family ATPase [Aquisalimonas lutea]|uniref:AAA family ATPase n=1 Tax=Aquisalimonas lutea TaxID=1327750 RepID=UPI0025B41665|nr:AAA family ATPase [Aquisalimonas lutea]MDN3516023.1 AAA family ATPase [Aquisalimonas lutea]
MDLSAFRHDDLVTSIEICAFCRRDAEAVDGFVAGHEAAMCNDCAAVLADELADHQHAILRERVRALPSPARLHAWLDHRVVGQEQAKRVLAVQVHNHYKRLAWRGMHGTDAGPGKCNVLLSGPTGSGKTRLLESLARCLDVPFAAVDATTLTPSGHQGAGIESVIQALLRDCDWDPACAARGIVYLDELDKLGGPDPDGRGAGVQQTLLQCLEGRRVGVQRPNGRWLSVSTRDVLFVGGGVFARDGRAAGGARPGEDDARWLLRQGLIPELVGRFPVHVPLDPPGIDVLRRLLTEPPDAPVRQMEALLAADGCALQVSGAALERMAGNALRRGMGARGLFAEVEGVLRDALFEVPGRADVERVNVDVDGDKVAARLVPRRRVFADSSAA